MNKIYFAPAWGLSNKNMTDWYKKQTPNESGIWDDLVCTYNKNEADFIVMQDVTSENINRSKTIFLGKEPNYIARHDCPNCFRSMHHEKGNSWMPQTWWVNLTYDELKNGKSPNKTKNLSVVSSRKTQSNGHKKRMKIINGLANKYPNDIDIWGSITNGRQNQGPYRTGLPPRDKKDGLLPYRYHFVCENGSTPYYFSEKIVDPLLCWSMPIYWGCKNIHKFLPEGSYININVDDPNAVDKIIDISKSDIREQNIDKIKEARELILDKYNIWSTVDLSIKSDNLIRDYVDTK